ncbi:uncharacterized protein FTOL_06893 [Fusarium torulosum]|uniref:Ankyrin repeat protein n=1 Tax=Fusarium torulosum TaxID=33205 RepID=A0AAE8SII6_9HYPO|nr:uncharacterized protein FTOL_06893 [Fusarium torulosum]
MMPSNPHSVNSSECHSVFLLHRVEDPQPFDPLGALLSQQDNPRYSRQAMFSPLCLAAIRNAPETIRDMHSRYQGYIQRELDLALFLANRQGHERAASMLIRYHANPGRESSANGLHGAAWAGLNHDIQRYINLSRANPDVTDGSSATPIIYAILGTQVEERAWETIEYLLAYGASPCARFGSEELSYAEIAQKEGKEHLARKFKEWEACPSPTILNSSRESSCMSEGDNDQPDNNRPQEGPEADRGASLSRESHCTVDDVQPNNKRPREDSEVNGGAKRARGA